MRNEKNRELNCLLPASSQPVSIASFVSEVKILLEETGSLTNRDWLGLVYTEYLGYVFAIEGEVRNHTQLVEALQRHEQHQAYGSDSFHALKVVKSQQ